jgi:hypothetical protein
MSRMDWMGGRRGDLGGGRSPLAMLAAKVVCAAGISLLVAFGARAGDDADGKSTAQNPPAQTAQPKQATTKLDEQDSREVLQSLQQLRRAVMERSKGDESSARAHISKTPLPNRPARSVTPPAITSAKLDQLIEQFLSKFSPKVQPAPLTSDIEFVRRIHFDLAGAPPTPQQVVAFVGDRSKDKRARLADALLESPEYARNWARYWRDVIRFHATNQAIQQVRYDILEDWLAEQFKKNAPWDQIATALITATGRVDENGAVSFALAHEAKPVEMAGEVSRIFLGVQIQCAQCHDHKTDSWKREQFHELAAFFSGARARPFVRGMPGQLPVFGVVAQGRPRYTMPDLNDPTKQVPIAPRFFLATSKSEPSLPESLDAVERRTLGAAYITGQDNPWFARAYVNRIWYALMGESFYEAIDDLGPERTPKAPEVIETLAREWQNGGYNVRWLFRTIVNTNAYQRRVRSTANAAGKTPFASNCPARLRSDQIVEALALALGMPADLTPVANNQGNRAMAAKGPGGKSKGPGPQPSSRPNVPTKNEARNAKQAVAAAGLGSAPVPAKGQAKIVRLGGPRVLFNALFGVDPSVPNEDVLGTIPQALFLMNSPMVHSRTQARPGTVLGEILMQAPNDQAALNALYLRVLSRHPTAKEIDACSHYMSNVGNRAEAFEDIYWALINSTEFISRR